MNITIPSAQPPEERNFCPRCGKRHGPPGHIHTCSPPADAYAQPQQEAIEHYERALKVAFPSGAEGAVFEHWNAARKALGGSHA